MKKFLMATFAGLLMTNAAVASSCNSGSTCEGSMLILMVSSMGTSGITMSPIALTDAALKNDIVQVQDDAALAKDTGALSPGLASVIMRIREQGSEQIKGATDEDIINAILAGEVSK